MDEYIGNVKLDETLYSGEDKYSDGDIENRLLEIVKDKKPCDFDRIIEEENNWPILYHLSTKRTNIINWYPLKKDWNVLEIGSGCGAITGELAKRNAKITCIELSKRRSMINAYRNREYNNIEIKIGNFQDIEKTLIEKYDLITLIGVFEYGKLYIQSENPFVDFLNTIRKHLKPNGAIVIAIENKLGLKYWAGCQEDHVPIYFESIQGYPKENGVQTFSKKELENIFSEVGFGEVNFFYPYPDYKFPTVIYSDDYLPKLGELNNNMRNYDKERMVLFDESKVYDSLIKEELFPVFSNSFFVELKV